MSWSDHPDNESGWLMLMVILGLVFGLIFAGVKISDKKQEIRVQPYAEHIFYCPECLTLFGKDAWHQKEYYYGWEVVKHLQGVCPEDGERLIPTPYKTWDDLESGTWRPKHGQ